MFETYGERRITWLDVCLGSSLAVIAIVLAINIVIQSVHLVYAAIVLVLGGLAYCTERCEAEKSSLRGLWILGLLSVVFYPLIDSLFEAKLGLVTYLTDDPRLIATPVYVPLYWVLGVLLFGYVYYRVQCLTRRVWMGALATGLFSAVSATFVENLFNAAEFYHNTPSDFMIGHIPVYVPLGYVVAFSFIPFYIRYRYVCGFLLYGLVGLWWYLFSLVVP